MLTRDFGRHSGSSSSEWASLPLLPAQNYCVNDSLEWYSSPFAGSPSHPPHPPHKESPRLGALHIDAAISRLSHRHLMTHIPYCALPLKSLL
jgi:hypothetical protein